MTWVLIYCIVEMVLVGLADWFCLCFQLVGFVGLVCLLCCVWLPTHCYFDKQKKAEPLNPAAERSLRFDSGRKRRRLREVKGFVWR